MDLNFIRRNLLRFLGAGNITASLPVASLPTAALGGSPPEISFTRPATVAPVAQSATVRPVAARPTVRTSASPAHDTFRLYEEQLKLDFDLESKLALASTPDAHRQIRAAFAQFRASKLRGKTIADIANTPFALRPTGKAATPPALDDDGVAQPIPTADDPIGDVITQLQRCLKQLKELHADVSADDADADEAQARSALARGDKAAALRHFDAAISKRGARIVTATRRSSLLAQPSSRQRATALIRQGFNSQDSVQALDAMLGRGPVAERSGMAFPPAVPPVRPAAVVTAASAAPDVAKIRSIKSDLAQLEIEQRKEFSNARNDKHAALSRQLKAELKKFHVR